MSLKLVLVLLTVVLDAVYGGVISSPIYATHGLGHVHTHAHAYAPAPLTYAYGTAALSAPAYTYTAPHYTAPHLHYAPAAPVLIDNTHFSYGYLQPYGNGHVSVARNGPIPSYSYSYRTGGGYYKK